MTHQIRALYDTSTITVYQAYSSAIALPAIEHQLLSASPSFSISRMTWIKPSWSWMLYRSGYSYKDSRQECILAIKMKREYFEKLLMTGVQSDDKENLKLMKGQQNSVEQGDSSSNSEGELQLNMRARIQWDPERNIMLDKVEGVRSIQIGIPSGLCKEWIKEGIVGIEDVTEKARELKGLLDEDHEGRLTEKGLSGSGLIPAERVYTLPEQVARIAGADI